MAGAAAFKAKVHFPNHNPIVNKPWVITWTASKGRHKLSGSTKYQFFIGKNTHTGPVSTQKGVKFRNGRGRDTLKFPGAAVGHQLTLRVADHHQVRDRRRQLAADDQESRPVPGARVVAEHVSRRTAARWCSMTSRSRSRRASWSP